MDEVIDDLISLESGFNDGGLDCMEANIMQNNVSMHRMHTTTVGNRYLWSKGRVHGFVQPIACL